METDKDPTFAEALLALAIAERNWHNGAAIGDAWEAGVTDAAKFVSGPSLMTYAPPSIRRALGVDGLPKELESDLLSIAVKRYQHAESERDALRAELETARANVLAANLRTRTANDERDALAAKLAEKEATRVRIYNELIAYQHERDRLAGIADRAGRILDEAAARKPLDAKEQS